MMKKYFKKEYKPYYIAYFDILGYRAFFERHRDNADEIHQYLEDNVNTAKTILRKRDDINFAGVNLTVKCFSDNFIILAESLEDIYGDTEVMALSCLVGILQVLILQKNRILIRGSITRGKVFIDENIVFGEGLIRAVDLEGRANFPRVIFDMDEERLDKAEYEDLSYCLAKDTDGAYYVDFFDAVKLLAFFYSQDIQTRLEQIRKSIIELVKEYGRFNDKSTDKSAIAEDAKVISRYIWLLEKFNAKCEENNLDNLMIFYEHHLNSRVMHTEIKVKE